MVDILHQTKADIHESCPKVINFVPEIKNYDEVTDLNKFNIQLAALNQSLDLLLQYEKDIQSFLDIIKIYASQLIQRQSNVSF